MALRFRGFSIAQPANRLAAGFASLSANVRAFLDGGFALRNPLSAAVISALPTPIHTIRRLNDSTPNGPSSGYSLIIGAGTSIYVWNSDIGLVLVATGLSGNPLSMIPFRPNTSPQPWMYCADSAIAGSVTLITKYLGLTLNGPAGTAVNFPSNGMLKVRSDGLCYKMGLKEPQIAPIVSTPNTNAGGSGTLEATTVPWNNYDSANSGYDFGQTDAYIGQPGASGTLDGTAPYVVDCLNASFITINSLTGTATVNGISAATPTTPGPVSATSPAYFKQVLGTPYAPPLSATIIVGCFTDGAGNVVPMGVAPLYVPSVVDVGTLIGVTNGITVPYGAVAFQIGINSNGNSFHLNSGSFSIAVTVTTNALPPVTATIGPLTAYYWGDSPTSGPTSAYIWKNPGDSGGSGPTRSTSNAVGSTTGNSFIFDCSFGSSAVPPLPPGIPGLPGVDISSGTNVTANPMEWTELNPQSAVTGSNAVFAAPITLPAPQNTNNIEFINFNFCLQGSIYFPSAGDFTFVLTNHDDVIWGIGGGVKLVSATASGSGEGSGTGISTKGQTITVVGGYPLLPRQNYTSGDGAHYAKTTVVVSVPAAGIYPIEIDYDFWYHSGRILLLMASPTAGASPTIIPPLTGGGASGGTGGGVKEDVQVRYVYRSSATGAPSNPSPASAPQTVPVLSNTYTSAWSPDPQDDVVDYYRIDSTTSGFTFANTGPNDGLGPLIGGVQYNTPVTDSLSDLELGTQILDYSNYEPFPSIDLPQKGTCNTSGGVITWVSGGAIGGTATGFNPRWLAGTVILIGSPTSLAYTMIARPIGNTITIPEVPDGTDLAYQIEQPVLANQPVPYMWGPSDNIPYALAVGDTLRRGTMYFSAASNLDAAPDTNQMEVTDPSEALVNGLMTGGKSFVGTIKRAIAIYANSSNAAAIATGTIGTVFSQRTTGINRGLFIPRCFCVSGGGMVYFRVDDGIHISPNGGESKSITDETLYPLFVHEGSVPAAVVRNGITIYPPDDTQPQLQKFSYVNGYCYWDYKGLDGNYHTLVFDEIAMGWIWDLYSTQVAIHAADEGESTQGVLVGCTDGTVRQLEAGGTETVTGTVLTPAIGSEGFTHLYQITVEYVSSATLALSFIVADSGNGSYAPDALTLPIATTPTKYTTKLSANKWQLLQMQFTSIDPALQVYLEGFCAQMRSWGSADEYQDVRPFTAAGGLGAEK